MEITFRLARERELTRPREQARVPSIGIGLGSYVKGDSHFGTYVGSNGIWGAIGAKGNHDCRSCLEKMELLALAAAIQRINNLTTFRVRVIPFSILTLRILADIRSSNMVPEWDYSKAIPTLPENYGTLLDTDCEIGPPTAPAEKARKMAIHLARLDADGELPTPPSEEVLDRCLKFVTEAFPYI